VKVTKDPLGSIEVERMVTKGGAMNDVFPDSTTETKVGLASVDSGGSVIVLVVVPVKRIDDGPGAGGEGTATGDVAWLVGLAEVCVVDDDFIASFVGELELVFVGLEVLTALEDFTAPES
jgi:hypothetical protein